MQPFQLAQRLANDCEFVMDWPLCQVLLMRDARYPWFILVPRRDGLRELCELSIEDDAQYRRESRALSQFMLKELKAEKLNVAALGNVEPQLHVHHIARFQSDDTWPAPVWGQKPPLAYNAGELRRLITGFRTQLEQLAQLRA